MLPSADVPTDPDRYKEFAATRANLDLIDKDLHRARKALLGIIYGHVDAQFARLSATIPVPEIRAYCDAVARREQCLVHQGRPGNEISYDAMIAACEREIAQAPKSCQENGVLTKNVRLAARLQSGVENQAAMKVTTLEVYEQMDLKRTPLVPKKFGLPQLQAPKFITDLLQRIRQRERFVFRIEAGQAN
jgi:hypothetical protein